jgi:hypothetical protein
LLIIPEIIHQINRQREATLTKKEGQTLKIIQGAKHDERRKKLLADWRFHVDKRP